MNDDVLDLSQMTDVRQTLASKPPSIVRGTMIVLLALLASAVGWSATSKTDLVVKAPVRVRPIT
jgi:hypothetical protein